MRKVYQSSNESAGWISSMLASLGFTALIFCILPFSHVIAKPKRILEMRKASVTDLPPTAEVEPPPAPPTEREEEVPPPPMADEAPHPAPLMADLDAAVGGGGVLPGFVASSGPAGEDLGTALDTFDVSELEKRPEVVSQVAPAYPPELRKARIEGLVTLAFLLTEEGRVDDPRVESSSRPEFERPALEAVRKWRFKPGMKDGQPVKTYLRLPIRFRVVTS